MSDGGPIVLFDGVCNLCNASVGFILKREKNQDLRFASLQSNAGRHLLRTHKFPPGYDRALIFVEGGIVHTGSTAALRIGLNLRFPWDMLARGGLLIPLFAREWIYRQIAAHRYTWFGKREMCLTPNKELAIRFL